MQSFFKEQGPPVQFQLRCSPLVGCQPSFAFIQSSKLIVLPSTGWNNHETRYVRDHLGRNRGLHRAILQRRSHMPLKPFDPFVLTMALARALRGSGITAGHLAGLQTLLINTCLADAADRSLATTFSSPSAAAQQHNQRLVSSSAPRGLCAPGGGGDPQSHHLTSMFTNNQFASGGLTLMAVGAAAAMAKSAFDHVLEYAQRRLFVRADIDSRDDAYRWLMHWLSQHPEFQRSPRVSVLTSLAAFGTKALEGGLVGKKQVLYIPAAGDHLVAFRGRWIWVTRTRAAAAAQASAGRTQLETLTLTAWGRDRHILEDLVAEAAAAYEATTRQRTVVHSVQDGYWDRVGSRPVRPITSIILPQSQAADILADCKEFLESEAWYAHHGVPHRRGYLLYGAPGTGKTSLVTALAGELGLDIYVVTLSSPSMTDEMLRSLLNSAAVRSLLLLEDVDAAFVGRGTAGASQNLSFSGLLNAIDGVAAQEGRLLFMTTNHIERLSGALIRPGRVDYRLEFKLADRDQIQRLFYYFFKDLHLFHPAAANFQAAAVDPTVPARTEGDHSHPSSASGNHPQTATSQPSGSNEPPASAQGPPTHPGRSRAGGRVPEAPHAVVSQAHLLESLAAEFASLIPDHSVSIAQLQGYLMQHKTSPARAVQDVTTWLASLPKPVQAVAVMVTPAPASTSDEL